jgi:alpha-L-fucosidase
MSTSNNNVVPAKMEWFVKARYGLFVHYGLYSLLGRGEWVLNREQIPPAEYEALASRFTAEKFDADAICDLAVRGGMKYVTFTTMHHDGFRLYDTKLSDYSTVRTASKRDLTAEMIAAARKRGLKIALYHSLNNWHDQPDAVDALESKEGYEKFIHHTFERFRELVTRYNPIDILWYDGWWPFHATGWQAERMNAMVRSIQPNIIINGRNALAGDFATPEGHMGSPTPWRPWEACMTHNDSWGFHSGDHAWKSPSAVARLLSTAAKGKGNLLLNIGPRGDGSVPEPSVKIIEEVGAWLSRGAAEAIYDTDIFTFDYEKRGNHKADWNYYGPMTARGNTLYWLVQRWVGGEMTLGGLVPRVKSVTLLGSSPQAVKYVQEGTRLRLTGLPVLSPDPLWPVLKIECDGPAEVYLTGGLRVPKAPHPPYDPVASDIKD